MAALNVRGAHSQPSRHDAITDAREMQASVAQECTKSGTEPPPYRLLELIGKGSFGRVYKAQAQVEASDATPAPASKLVSIKIISIESGDALNPGANTFGDIMQEVETLKLLRNAGARNINIVVDALLVGHAIWMVTEYCAGGSVSTLMKAVGRLHEKWIVPLLREVAEGISWIHKHGILHRDIKSANVLVTEQGAVQLCDFGVAAVVQTRLDKRSTITGSLHWMAPELFDPGAKYGTEVDIWAFGSMAYEVATGLPPNASFRDISRFGAYLRSYCPRLEGSEYSSGLKDFVACCMVDDPLQRPPIERLQQHPYIFNTEAECPATSLSELVHTYKLWEAQGGSRASLFSAAGAQRDAVADASSLAPDEWNFSTLDDSAQATILKSHSPVPDAYGTAATIQSKPRTRRRMPPPPIARPPTAPLERLFDPNTISSYRDISRKFYAPPWEAMSQEIPPRGASSDAQSIRDSLIDLDAALGDDLLTVQPPTERLSSDPADTTADASRRRTMDWTFPSDAPTSGYLTPDHDPGFASSDDERTLIQSQRGLVAQFPQALPPADNRASTLSLIDLDASIPDELYQPSRPSTAGSDAQSDVSYTPFGLETHAFESATQPSEAPVYFDYGLPTAGTGSESDLEASNSDYDGPATLPGHDRSPSHDGRSPGVQLLALPQPPETAVMLGTASRDVVKAELSRLISSFQDELAFARASLDKLPTAGDLI